MNVEIGSMETPEVITTVARDDGKVVVHANVKFWWANHGKEDATVGKVPVHFTNPKHFHDIEAEIRPALPIPPGASGTAQGSPLLVVMVFNAPPDLHQPITGELLKQEGMEIRITQESGAQTNWQ